MSPGASARSRRGLLVTVALLLGFLVVLDLARDRSVIRWVWQGVTDPGGAPIERVLRGVGIIRR